MLNPFKKNPFVLDISDFSIELLQVKKGIGGKLSLTNFARTKLDEGTVEDSRILDKDRFKDKINSLISRVGEKKLGTKRLIFSLPESKTFLHIFSLPSDIKKKNLAHALESQAFKTIPLNPEEIYFDFQVVAQKEDHQEVLYVATPKEIVNEYVEVFKELGLEPVALDIESASLGRAFKNQESVMGATLIIDIGARKTVLTVLYKGSIRMSSIVFVAGNYFDKKIAEELGLPQRKAEMLRRKYGLKREGKGEKVAPILEKSMAEILGKADRLVSFYEKRSKKKIEKVLLAGGCSLMPEMAPYFSDNLGILSEVSDPSKLFPGLKKVLEEKPNKEKPLGHQKFHPVLFSNAVGLGLRTLESDPETDGINLIPTKQRPGQPTFLKRELNRNRVFNIIVGVFTLLNLLFFWWVVYQYLYKAIWGQPSSRETPQVEEGVDQEPSPEEETESEETVPEEATTSEEEAPVEEATSSEEVAPEVSVSVLNGSGVSGQAGEVADLLEEEGYQIGSIGNADSFDYEETLIQYPAGRKEEAEGIRGALGTGSIEMTEELEEMVIIVGQDLVLE